MPSKTGFCMVCCRHHFFDVGCDPTDKRYTANARALGAALAIEEMAKPGNTSYQALRRRTDDEDLSGSDDFA